RLTPAFLRTLVHAVLNEVIGRVGALGRGLPKANTNHSGRHSPNRRVYQAAGASSAAIAVSFSGIAVVQGQYRPGAGERIGALVEIDLSPAQISDFAAAHAGQQGDTHKRKRHCAAIPRGMLQKPLSSSDDNARPTSLGSSKRLRSGHSTRYSWP